MFAVSLEGPAGDGDRGQLRPCAARRHVDLLVAGSRGHGDFTGILLGSISLHCLNHATCPVVVTRDPEARHSNLRAGS